MGAPAHLSRRRALLAEALDAPGVDELVHLLRPIGNLRVTLAAVDDPDAELAGQMVELPRLGVMCDLLRLSPHDLPIRQSVPGDIQESVLGEVADQAGVCPVLYHRARPRLTP